MHVSQNSDTPPLGAVVPAAARRQVPEAHAAQHAGLRWRVPQDFHFTQVCCSRWAQLPGAINNIATRACYSGATADFDAKLLPEHQNQVKDRLATYEYPKEIEFVDTLPMTTGKVQRRVLRLQEEQGVRAMEGKP